MDNKDSFSDAARHTPRTLLEALKGYDTAVFQALLDGGADPKANNMEAITAAIDHQNADALARMLKTGINLKEDADQHALVYACMKPDPAILSLLLENGANAAHANSAGIRVVVSIAVLGANHPAILACIKLLVEHGADPCVSAGSALVAAVRNKHTEAVWYLFDQGVSAEEKYGMLYHPVCLAARFGDTARIEKIAREGKTPVTYFNEALHMAAEFGQREVVWQILDYKFPHEQGKDYDIAVSAAVGGQVELLRELFEKGFRTDLTRPDLLEMVIENDSGATLDFMMDEGAVEFTQAHLLYNRTSNKIGKPLSSVHKTLQMWTQRRMTILRDISGGVATPEDLRKTDPDHENRPLTRLMQLVQRNDFEHVMEVVRQAGGGVLKPEDVLTEDGAGNTALEILGARKKLGQVFYPELWVNGMEDLKILYQKTPAIYRAQADFPRLLAEDRQKKMKAHGKPGIRLRKN